MQPFLAQAEQEKLDYEAKKKMYEEGSSGHFGSFNFSILPGSPMDGASIPRAFKAAVAPVKAEPAPSEGEGFMIEDGLLGRPFRA